MNSSKPKPAESAPVKPVAVEGLPERLRELVVKGLKEGWSVEGVAEAVASEGEGFSVTPAGVENFFWSSPRLWADRILWKKGQVEQMKQALEKPGSPEALLMDSMLMSGLTDLYQQSRRIRAKDVATVSLQRELLRAREELVALKVKRQQKEELLMDARVEQIRRRNDLMREQLKQLRKLAASEAGRVGPELLRQIEQIYGLAYLPDIPAESVNEP